MDNTILIVLIVNSLGLPVIVGFVGKIWYKANRHEELLNNLFEYKKETRQKVEELQGSILKNSNRFEVTLTQIESSLAHLNKTLDALSSRLEYISRSRSN